MNFKKNIINLFFSQVAGFLVPLLMLPHLTRVLGVEYFGLYVFSYNLIVFFQIVTDYGLELYLPKELLSFNSNNQLVNQKFTSSLLVRALLFLVALLGVLVVYMCTDYYKDLLGVLVFVVIIIFINSFNLLWLFQSKEILFIYSRIVVVCRLGMLVLVFYFVQSSNDLFFLFAILSISSAAISISCFYYAFNYLGLRPKGGDFKNTKIILRGSFSYFISRVGVSIYSVMGGVFLGALSGSLKEVAYYGAAYQLYSAGVQIVSVVSTPLLPFMLKTKDYEVFFKVLIGLVCVTLVGAFVGFVWGSEIILLVYGSELLGAKAVLNIFMLIIPISIVGIMFGYPALLPLGREVVANFSVVVSGVFLLLALGLIYSIGVNVTAVVVAIVYMGCELIMLTMRSISFVLAYGEK